MTSEDAAVVFQNGADGYPFFRIPSLLYISATLLLAFAEGRRQRQDHGQVDIVLKRSIDGGASWSALSVVHTETRATIGNPAPLYDDPEAVLIFCRDNKDVLLTRSIDGGVSWSVPLPIGWSRPPEWAWVATGPPASLVSRRGRWLVPCDGLSGSKQVRS